jgi:hypothetical protein
MTQQNTVKRKVVRAKSTNNASGTKPRTTPAISRNGNSLKFLKRIGYSNIHTLTDDESAFFFDAGMMIDADGAYHAYHPKGKPGLDFLANAGEPGNWWALVTENGRPSGKPIIQSKKDPAPGYYISTTSLENKKCDRRDPRRYVNSESINFVVLPGRLGLGTKLGDLTVAIRPANGATAFAIYGDVGPARKIGEGSIALANALKVPSNPKNGGVGHGVVYIVFPGSTEGWPLSQVEIDKKGSELFAKWGGVERAKQVFPEHNWPTAKAAA